MSPARAGAGPTGASYVYGGFDLAFWHPFGPHGRESTAEIIARKRAEIAANGWTLWSFQYRTSRTFEAWLRELGDPPAPTYVFCSDSRGAVDPARDGSRSRTIDCGAFAFVGDTLRRPMPSGVRVPHPFQPGRTTASAFVVRRVLHPVVPFTPPAVQWFSPKDEVAAWYDTPIPTRGEYLIRAGGTDAMRPVGAVLELQAPYLASVYADEALL